MQKHFGIVLMVDALGVSQYNIDECKQFLERQKELETCLVRLKEIFGEESQHYKLSQTSIFGDTIVHCWPITQKEKKDRFWILGNAVSDACEIVRWGLKNGILFRGCIAIGDYISEKNTVLGPAIFDAHDWYESANWFGIIFSPKAQLWIEAVFETQHRKKKKTQIDDLIEGELEKTILLYDVPLSHPFDSQDTKKFLTIGWPFSYYVQVEYSAWSLVGQGAEKTEETPREILLQQLFKIKESKEGEPKYKNGIEFFDWYGKTVNYAKKVKTKGKK